MKKIKYKDIMDDKDNLIKIINDMITLYKIRKHHTQILECEQWILMLQRQPIQTEYTSDALLTLKCILNDCANINLCLGGFEIGNIAMNLMFKIIKLFKENEKD